MQRNLALLRPRYQSGAGKVKFQTAIKMEKNHRGIFQRMPFHQLDISEGKSDIGKEQLIDQELFNPQSSYVSSSRIIYTPSTFARTSLLHLQEVGSLQAVHPHISQRSDLVSRCLVWRGADLSAERGRLRACGVRYYEILIK